MLPRFRLVGDDVSTSSTGRYFSSMSKSLLHMSFKSEGVTNLHIHDWICFSPVRTSSTLCVKHVKYGVRNRENCRGNLGQSSDKPSVLFALQMNYLYFCHPRQMQAHLVGPVGPSTAKRRSLVEYDHGMDPAYVCIVRQVYKAIC